MSKMVVCVTRPDFSDVSVGLVSSVYSPLFLQELVFTNEEDYKVVDELLSLDSTLESRDTCETDNTLMQLISYIAYYKTNENGVKEYLSYRRGRAGDEPKLHDLYSIGVGGHADSYVDADFEEDKLKLTVMECIRNETKEEIGFDINVDEIDLDNIVVLFSDTNEVGKYHLGISTDIDVKTNLF
ncbi:MAG: hypothetical protein PF450_04555, partial [Bacteroidales bacterium]|nr:hypothetical protein [Bacteroidales bacterium]